MAEHGPGELVDRIQVPTLLMQGTADTLFPLDEAVANFDQIGDNPLRTAAIKAREAQEEAEATARFGRADPAGPGQDDLVLRRPWCLPDRRGGGRDLSGPAQLAWFDRYLRGRQDTDTGPKFAWIADDAQLRSSDAYPLKAAGQL